jgi:hypothetical protein
MNLHAPNIILFAISGGLAMLGVLAALPIGLPIPGLFENNSSLFIFLGWFLLSASTVLPQTADAPAVQQMQQSSPG